MWKGEVVKTTAAGETQSQLGLNFEVMPEESGWFAARVFEQPSVTIRFAQTSPVYVQVGRDGGIVPEDVRYFLGWMDREINSYENVSDFRNDTDRQAMVDLFRKARLRAISKTLNSKGTVPSIVGKAAVGGGRHETARFFEGTRWNDWTGRKAVQS